MSVWIIKNLAGIFTGEGFLSTEGRKPTIQDCSFIQGPIDLYIDRTTGRVLQTAKTKRSNEIPSEIKDRQTQAFDATGLIATPGFIDSHTHALFSGTRANEYFSRWKGLSYREISDAGGGIHNTFTMTKESSDEVLQWELLDRLHTMAKKGTTCVEVKTGYADDSAGELRLLRLLKKVVQMDSLPVRLRRTFLPLHALPKGQKEEAFVNEMMALLPTVQKEQLADHVDAFPEEGFFSLEQSLRFAKEAKKQGLRSKIHADELTPMKSVESFVPLEALSVDHLQKISQKGVDALVKSQTVASFLPATSFFLDLEYAPARRLVDAGARVALATDFNPGTAPDSDLLFTARLAASKMKLSASEIFCGLTYNAAAALGMEKDLGHLSPGSMADFSLWKTYAKEGEEVLQEIFVEAPRPQKVWVGAREIL